MKEKTKASYAYVWVSILATQVDESCLMYCWYDRNRWQLALQL